MVPCMRWRCTVILLQEKYWNNDPWRVLIICILLNRTQGRTAEPVISELFERWPTAPALADECTVGELYALISFLGFGEKRTQYILGTSYCCAKAMILGKKITEISVREMPGCGSYAKEAWDMIVLGRRDFWPNDKELLKRMKVLRSCEGA